MRGFYGQGGIMSSLSPAASALKRRLGEIIDVNVTKSQIGIGEMVGTEVLTPLRRIRRRDAD